MHQTYEIIETKTGKKVPIIDGVHLHSRYNPVKEAEDFVEEHLNTIKSTNNILCLGLGFGYHVYQILFKLNEQYKNNFRIVVIEPNHQTYTDSKKYNLIPNQNVTVINGIDLPQIYTNKDLVDFLLKKPGVISHPASFNLYKDFFTQFLTYKAPTTIQQISSHISDKHLKQHLQTFTKKSSLSEVMKLEVGQTEKELNNLDHILIAFNNLDKMSGKHEVLKHE